MMDIQWIRSKVQNGEYYLSRHADRERQDDNLAIEEIEQAILSGRVLEPYADTGRGESCLVVGFADNGKPIHVVCGYRGEQLAVITVYIPSPPRFKNPYERG